MRAAEPMLVFLALCAGFAALPLSLRAPNVDAPEPFNDALRAFLDVGPPDPEAGRPDVIG